MSVNNRCSSPYPTEVIMKIQEPNVQELLQAAEAVEKLAAKPEIFKEAYEAFLKDDAERFEAALNKAAVAEHCRLLCHFFCRKHCGWICRRFCPNPNREEVNAEEVLAFARAITPLLKEEKAILYLHGIMEAENVDAWSAFLKEYKLERFCQQLCSLLCSWRCKRKCHLVCPAKPLITNVGSIPVDQINAAGYGSGPSDPLGQVGSPNPAAGYGDHPFGGLVWIKGIFNMATAIEYLVELSSTGPAGAYSPIIVGPQTGKDSNPAQPPPPPGVPPPPPPPFLISRSRSQSIGPDPGWFKVNEITDSEGGRQATGEKRLLVWPTGALDGVVHIRLKVRDASMNVRVSSPQVVRLDNTGPFPLPRPTIALQLKKNDGTLVPLKCGKVKKGEGLIQVTIHAYDPNMSGVSVTARGNSGLSVPVVDINAVPLSKTYNGNIADQGYPVPTDFLWDPWSDPRMVPCCYLVYVEINDRTIINDNYSGGHGNSGWEAIEIGF